MTRAMNGWERRGCLFGQWAATLKRVSLGIRLWSGPNGTFGQDQMPRLRQIVTPTGLRQTDHQRDPVPRPQKPADSDRRREYGDAQPRHEKRLGSSGWISPAPPSPFLPYRPALLHIGRLSQVPDLTVVAAKLVRQVRGQVGHQLGA
jgi:hypothetical protein